MRTPRALEGDFWKVKENETNFKKVYGYEFSQNMIRKRKNLLFKSEANINFLEILKNSNSTVHFKMFSECGDFEILDQIEFGGFSFGRLEEHTILKLILNTHSTLVMGRMDRYSSNIMTFVKASNNKLIDRAIRNVRCLLDQHNSDVANTKISKEVSYRDICYFLFWQLEDNKNDEAIVLRTFYKIIDYFKR
jgi:N-acetylmuramic acid 6-phosphate etherase